MITSWPFQYTCHHHYLQNHLVEETLFRVFPLYFFYFEVVAHLVFGQPAPVLSGAGCSFANCATNTDFLFTTCDKKLRFGFFKKFKMILEVCDLSHLSPICLDLDLRFNIGGIIPCPRNLFILSNPLIKGDSFSMGRGSSSFIEVQSFDIQPLF